MTSAGLALEVDPQFCNQAKGIFHRLDKVKHGIGNAQSFLPLLYRVRAQLIEQAYRGDGAGMDMAMGLKLAGPNKSKLDYEIFQPHKVKKYDPQAFEARTRLKIQRTILNLKELQKAYRTKALQELQEQLQTHLQASTNPLTLRQKLLSLARSSNFSTYLSLKKEFLDKWTGEQASFEGKFESTPLVNQALADTMKALLRQKSNLKQKSQVLRFTDYQFFQPFNATNHDAICSNDLEFWQTPENQQAFVQMVQTIRKHYPVQAPFHIFRFAESFTYLLCGFSDDCTTDAILQGHDTAPVHAKILMRQSDKSYRELLSYDTENRTLYFNCLKEALLPFVEALNTGLQMNLPESFIKFFRI